MKTIARRIGDEIRRVLPRWKRSILKRVNLQAAGFGIPRRKFRTIDPRRGPDRFVLYRIVGNDLPPRHKPGQSRENVRFILEHEPELAACEKRWIVNRIVDVAEERAIINLLEQREQKYTRIPFDREAYARCDWKLEGFPDRGFFLSTAFAGMGESQRLSAEIDSRGEKVLYAMNNNGARNTALREGRTLAEWVLPWDGNCFLTAEAWNAIVSAVRSQSQLNYFIVPMMRLDDNDALLSATFVPQAMDEPQILFHRDAGEEFDETFRYGQLPKAELLQRLKVPGIWETWVVPPWVKQRPASREAGQFASAGWVARLSSGKHEFEIGPNSRVKRSFARSYSILGLIEQMDVDVLARRHDASRLANYSEDLLDSVRRAASEPAHASHALSRRLIAEAEAALGRGPFSVLDKTALAPSGDRQDYWTRSPYLWPNPQSPDGLPYIRRDGKRAPGTALFEPGSERFDRSSLQRVFDDSAVLAIAWRATGRANFAEHSARLVRGWFIDPRTRMHPHLRYAQYKGEVQSRKVEGGGIIEMKDLYFLLDAVRLLDRAQAFSEADKKALASWFRAYLEWLTSSEQGQDARHRKNNHGTFYDLQAAALALYLGDHARLVAIFRDSRERILMQFEPDGSQPHELRRTESLHYCCFNLLGWVHLATLAESCGEDLWGFQGSDGRSLRRGLEWLLACLPKRYWEYPQTSPYDWDRLLPLYYAYRERFGAVPQLEGFEPPAPLALDPLFHPFAGTEPFWQLGASLR